MTKVTKITDSDGKEVPVPKGYVGSQVTGENKVADGFVIYEGSKNVNDSNSWDEQISRNQWVWIPVENPNRIYEEINGVKKSKLYNLGIAGISLCENDNLEPGIVSDYDNVSNLSNIGITEMTPDKLYQELQLEFDETIKSIEKYGGFYVGRYETGNLSKDEPVIQRMNEDICYQTWYTMYGKMRYLAANENVKTNMIWGCLYDEMIQWLIEMECRWAATTVEYACSGWGNYPNSNFNYINSSWQTVNKPSGSAIRIPTGSADFTKSLNIYDIAGNVNEWTLEAQGKKLRVLRSGNYYQDSYFAPAGMRAGNNPNVVSEQSGTRAYLYIK